MPLEEPNTITLDEGTQMTAACRSSYHLSSAPPNIGSKDCFPAVQCIPAVHCVGFSCGPPKLVCAGGAHSRSLGGAKAQVAEGDRRG